MSKPVRKPSESAGRPAAIHDVAAAAGVSIATVSRFLNRPELVARATADKVEQAIEQFGYRPNPFAQGLMTRRSQIVGILLPDIHGEFYSELLRGADQEAHRRGYHLLISSEARVDAADLSPVFGLIDGLAVMITEPNQGLSERVRDSGVPVIMLDSEPRDDASMVVDSIVVDNEPGSQEATLHLLSSTSAERCYFVGGPRDNFDTRQRAEVFTRVLREHGDSSPPPERRVYFGEYSSRWGHDWAQNIMARLDQGPIGVLAANDEIAYGVMRAFQDRGLSVPGVCRIVGFDDTRLAGLLRPTLSSVRVPMAPLGAAAIATLIDRIESRGEGSPTAANHRPPTSMPTTPSTTAPDAPSSANGPRPPVRLRLPTQLIIRESSKPV